jgi:hypothetical protein
VSPALVGALAIAVVVAGVGLLVEIGSSRNALAPLFLVQLLAASSGVAGPARRGHYDLLLTSGESRVSIGLMHWAMSIAPGVLGWLAIAALDVALEVTLRRSLATISLSSGTLVAMLLVSTLPWAVTAPCPKLTGGIAWLLLLAIAMALMSEAWWNTSPAVFLYPWLWVGHRLARSDVPLVAAMLAVAGAAMTATLAWMRRMDVPLEAPP